MMTKFLKILTIGIIGISLMACSGKKETVTECVSPEKTSLQLVMKNSALLHSEGDNMTKEIDTISYTYQPASGEDKDASKTHFKAFTDQLKAQIPTKLDPIEGVTIEITEENFSLTMLITIDYEQTDLQELMDKKIIAAPSNETVKFVSLKATTESLEKQNYTCTVKE